MSTFIGIAASSGVSTINYTAINAYYHVQSSKLCQGLGTASVVYVVGSGSSINTIGRAYSSSATIFSDAGLTTSASMGYYSNVNGGSGNIYYNWGTGWSTSGSCP